WDDDPVDPIRVWLDPEKSDGAGGPGYGVLNGFEHAWPPPESVWVEAIETYDEMDLTFTVSTVGRSTLSIDTIKTKGEPAYNYRLRVVMLVEPDIADYENPPNPTGGCRLKESQVKDIVRQLILMGSSMHEGVQFIWDEDETVVKLESECMKWIGLLGLPGVSVCGDLPAPLNNYRMLKLNWFETNVLDHAAGGPAGLRQADNYKPHDCWLNIYFTGNFIDSDTPPLPHIPGMSDVVWGTTSIIVGGGIRDSLFVLINDAAFFDDGVSEAGMTIRSDTIYARRTMLHEVACHWLTRGRGYPDGHEPIRYGRCPQTICVSGLDLDNLAGICYPAGALIEDPNDENFGLRIPAPERDAYVPKDPVKNAMEPEIFQCRGF
ncbi:MAG: hypothetical protein JSU63_08050, partial [Phycisphaerales bacterium]